MIVGNYSIFYAREDLETYPNTPHIPPDQIVSYKLLWDTLNKYTRNVH